MSPLRRQRIYCELFNVANTATTDKCAILHIGKNNPYNRYTLNGVELVAVNEDQDLKVIITNDLKGKPHVPYIPVARSILSEVSKFHLKNVHNIYKTKAKILSRSLEPILCKRY